MFPSDINKPHNYYFDSPGYRWGQYLVVRSTSANNACERILCIDLRSNQLIWEKDFSPKQEKSTNRIVGIGDKCYFVMHNRNQVSFLYQADLITGDTTLLYTANNAFFSGGKLGVTESMQLHFLFGMDTLIYLVNYNLENQAILSKIQVPLNEYRPSAGLSQCEFTDDRIYYCSANTTFCLDLVSGEKIWEYTNRSKKCNLITISNDILFTYSYDGYIGLDARTGKELYIGDESAQWAYIHDNIVYFDNYAGQIMVVDLLSGNVLDKIICPSERGGKGRFSNGTDAVVYGDWLYLMSSNMVYCYPKYPW